MHCELLSVADQVVLVSGGSRGIGRAIAKGFVDHGARVIITGRHEQTLRETARQLSAAPNAVTPLVCDVADSAWPCAVQPGRSLTPCTASTRS